MSEIIVIGYENCNKALKAIGQNIIDRSDDITNDLEKVEKIIVHAELVPGELANFNITKNTLLILKIVKIRRINMYPELKTRLMNSLKSELDYVKKFETDKSTKLDK